MAVNTIKLPSSVSLIKKASNTSNLNNSTPKPDPMSTSSNAKSLENENTDRPKTFLRVKSLTALQNVPSECITIPDDPLPPPPPLILLQKPLIKDSNDVVEIIDDNKEDEKANNTQKVSLVNGTNKDDNYNLERGECIAYSLKEPYSEDLKKILKGMKVVLEKSTEIDELVKNNFNRVNGDISG